MNQETEKKKILVIEDEEDISNIVRFNLNKNCYETDAAYDGASGLQKALSGDYALILLDLMLPVMDGFDVCRKIREKSNVPIIMLTAKEEEFDKVFGLELGADDYITKPFGMRELMARVKANIRRYADTDTPSSESDRKRYGNIEIDTKRMEVRKNGELIEFTLREFELLKFLAENEEKVFSREQLLSKVWNYEYTGDIRTVDVTVRRLREKLEDSCSEPKYIMTKRGIGYYFKRAEQ